MLFHCKIADFRGFEKKPLLKWAGARYAFFEHDSCNAILLGSYYQTSTYKCYRPGF